MSCNHCVNHVKTALTEDIKGIDVKEVNLDGKYALVDMADGVNEDELKALIADLGFELKAIQQIHIIYKGLKIKLKDQFYDFLQKTIKKRP